MADLLFDSAPGSADLVFGSAGTPPVILALGGAATLSAPATFGGLRADAVALHSTAALPGLTVPCVLSPVPALTASAPLPPAVPELGLGYDNAVNQIGRAHV